MDKFNVSLVCTADVGEKLLDVLLAHCGDKAILSSPIFSHGTSTVRLSAIERVLGRGHSLHVQVFMTRDEFAALQQTLQAEFAGTGLRYWASPVAIEGALA